MNLILMRDRPLFMQVIVAAVVSYLAILSRGTCPVDVWKTMWVRVQVAESRSSSSWLKFLFTTIDPGGYRSDQALAKSWRGE